MEKTYYQIFQIAPDANIQEINKAYRKLMLKYHPDKNNGKQRKSYAIVKHIYDVLSNPITRAEYDKSLQENDEQHDYFNIKSLLNELRDRYNVTDHETQLLHDVINNRNLSEKTLEKLDEVFVDRISQFIYSLR